MGCTLISVTEHAGSRGKDDVPLSEEKKEEMQSKGIRTLISMQNAGVNEEKKML